MQYHWIVGRPIWLAVCCCYATATLLVKPQNASASEGHRVQLNCSTDSVGRPINWRNISVAEGDSEVDIFLNGTFVNGYDDRFQMDVDKAKGVYNLVIPSVQLRDAGTYRCRDKDGAGLYDDAILNVTENYDLQIAPEHTEVQVGESVQLNCTTYYKTEPVNWQHIPFGKAIPVDVYISGKIVNGYASRYEAQMTNTTGTSNLNITAVELRDGGLYRCIQKDGLGHHKDAELRVIGHTETYDSSTHSYVPDIDSSSTDKKMDLIWLLIGLPIVLILIAVIAAIYICHRRERNQFSTPPEQEDERAENETL